MADKTTNKSRGSATMYVTIVGSLMGGVSLGLVLGYASPAVPSMMSNSTRTILDPVKDASVKTWISSIPNVGAIIGGLSGGYLSGLKGRKICLIATSLPLIFGWLMIMAARGPTLVIIGRLITGVCGGIFTASIPTYISELSPIAMRGTLGTSFQVSVTFGVLLASIFGMFTPWTWLSVICAIPALLMPLILLYGVESPIYLFNKYGDSQMTADVLKKIRSSDSDIMTELGQISRCPQEKQPMILSYSQIKKPTVYKPMLYAWGILMFQQASGVNAVIFNEIDIFKLSKIKMSTDLCSIILNAIAVAATIFSGTISDKFGRKQLLFVSGLGNTFGLLSLAACFWLTDRDENFGAKYGWIALLSTILFLSSFAIGYGPIPWLIGPELAPYSARGFILATGTFLNWGTAFVITKEFEDMKHALTTGGTFLFYSFISILAIFFTVFLLPETRGKTSEEILAMYSEKKEKIKVNVNNNVGFC